MSSTQLGLISVVSGKPWIFTRVRSDNFPTLFYKPSLKITEDMVKALRLHELEIDRLCCNYLIPPAGSVKRWSGKGEARDILSLRKHFTDPATTVTFGPKELEIIRAHFPVEIKQFLFDAHYLKARLAHEPNLELHCPEIFQSAQRWDRSLDHLV